jgi:hypothetical protein
MELLLGGNDNMANSMNTKLYNLIVNVYIQ